MSKFNTSINKLNELWQQVEQNNNQKKLKNNDDKFEFFIDLLKQQNIKIPTKVFDSGNINFPFVEAVTPTAIKSELMPTSINYSKNIDINLPEVLLPFVKYSIEIISQPETQIRGVYEFDPSTWIGDDIEVKGDSTLIYKGQPIVQSSINNFFITFPTTFFLDKGISLSLSKETWLVELESSTRGSHTGKILTVDATEITNEDSCLNLDDTKKFIIKHFDEKDHRITQLTTTGCTGVGDEIITTFTPDGEGGCNTDIVTNTNVTRTIVFADMDDFGFTLAEPSQTGLRYDKAEIIELEITKQNRWLFYSTELQKIFSTVITNTNDGDFQEIELSNLPDTNDGDTLPYTSITLKRNLEFTNPIPTIAKKSENLLLFQSTGTFLSLSRSGREFKNYIKTSDSNADTPTYRFNLQGSFLLLAPSTQIRFITRDKGSITTQEFKSLGSNDFNVQINKGLSTFISGTVANIFHREERLSGSIITEFFTDPENNPKHNILSLNSTTYQAIGDETVTIIPIDPELPPVITTRSNIIQTKTFADSVNYSIGIIDGVDFPIYNDIYTVVGTTYNLTTENHSILSKDIWVPSIDEVTLNIKAHLINPLYWREERKYNK